MIYFSVNLLIQQRSVQSDDDDDAHATNSLTRSFIFFGIVARNLLTFYSTTLFTLYSLKYKSQTDYNMDARFNTKLNILSLDVIMTHKMPYSAFKAYICKHAHTYDVYMNLYCLIELYRNKLKMLRIMA